MTWRPRQRLGKFRERITIERATVEESTGQPIRTWAEHLTSVPASFEPATGGETVRGRQVEANVKAVFEVHYNGNVTPEDRIVYGGWIWGIVAILPHEGGKRYMSIHCQNVATSNALPAAPSGQVLVVDSAAEYVLDSSSEYVTADA